MDLRDAVARELDSEGDGHGIEGALAVMCSALGVDRVSLHAVNQADGSFRVIGGGGDDILARGTELPLDMSSQVRVPAAGGIFRSSSFGSEGSFDRPLDHLVSDMGFQSGCSVPLFMGSQPMAALCASARTDALDCDPVISGLDEVSHDIALALHAVEAPPPRRILVCHEEVLIGQGMARILEHAFAVSIEICAGPDDALRRVQSGERIDTVVCDSYFAAGQVHSFLRALRSAGTSAPALVVASNDSPLSRTLALNSGAAAYALLSDGPEAIINAVRRLEQGHASGLTPCEGDGERPHLTAQESRVLLLLERGLRFKQIALELRITEATAKGYARSLFGKLNAHSRGEAVYEARRLGMLDFLLRGAATVPVVVDI
jgi:DNA-binding NarL/FixJ family response regulator